MVVENETIDYIGYDSEISKLHADKIVNLNGKTILPSFIDAHLHLRFAAEPFFGLDLTTCESVEDYVSAIKNYLKNNPNAEVLKGFGWHDRNFESIGPNKKILDDVCPNKPIVFLADSGHSIWVNSKTLELCKIDISTKNIGKGVIEHYPNGEPSGTIREDCMSLVNSVIPDYSVEQYKTAFLNDIKFLNKLGYTGMMDAYLNPGSNSIAALKELAKNGKLKSYIRGTYFMYPYLNLNDQIKSFVKHRPSDDVNDSFSINIVKFFLDGVIESKTAYLLEPYLDDNGQLGDYYGEPVWEQKQLNDAVALAIENGFQVEVHCIGDAALEEALLAFENAEKLGLKSKRNIIAHIELINDNQMKRFKNLNLIPLLNPYWAEIDDLYYAMLDLIGEERANKIWPINSFIEEGITCSTGSDYPITEIPNPFVGIELGITRTISKNYHPWAAEYDSGIYDKQLGPDSEKASLNSMLNMFSYGSAYSLYMDKFTGSLEVGKNADFIIIDKDIEHLKSDDISSIKVLSTYFKGQEIYRKENKDE